MGLFSLEHGRLAYRADFVCYGAAVLLMAVALPLGAPLRQWPALAALVLLGLGLWSLAEYGLHRFVLHGVQPFHRWHLAHHQRPQALIGSPTLMSATLFAALVFAPAWRLIGLWPATAVTLGMVAGYLGYAMVHHAMHHLPARHSWLRQRRYWHALHHGGARQPCCYGVSSAFWDNVFGSLPRPTRRTAAAASRHANAVVKQQ